MSGDSLQKIKEYRVRNIRTAQRAQGKRRMRVFQKPDTDLYPGSMEAKACLTIHGPVTHCSALCWASWVCACGVSRSSAGGMPDSRSFPAGRRSHSLTKKFPSLSLVRGGMGESSGGAELRPTGKQRSPRRVTESGVTGVAERKTVFSDRLSENTNDAGQSRQNGACRKEKRGDAFFRRFTEQPGQYDWAEESQASVYHTSARLRLTARSAPPLPESPGSRRWRHPEHKAVESEPVWTPSGKPSRTERPHTCPREGAQKE